jgi:hypothetical protein
MATIATTATIVTMATMATIKSNPFWLKNEFANYSKIKIALHSVAFLVSYLSIASSSVYPDFIRVG